MKELEALLYPLGLSNRRAISLKRCSQQYIDLGWPCDDSTALDVNVFFGAGIYASDSFRIYSDLLPGQGAPSRETEWITYQQTKVLDPAVDRPARSNGQDGDDVWRTVRPKGTKSEMGGCTDDDRQRIEALLGTFVPCPVPNSSQLQMWRWGIEGIVYDAEKGPLITDPWDDARLRNDAARSTASEKAPVPA